MRLIKKIEKELRENGNKISSKFVEEIGNEAEKIFFHTKHSVVCVLVLKSGHEVIGYGQVLDVKNFNIEIGKRIAEQNAREKLWEIVGAIAKLYIND